MPTNLYGPNDNFDLERSHVLPALIRKICLGCYLEQNDWNAIRRDLDRRPIEGINGTASERSIFEKLDKYGLRKVSSDVVQVEIWGTGTPLREFLWSEEMADACVFIMENVDFDDLKPQGTKEIRNCHINIGTGKEISIGDVAQLIKKTAGFTGELYFNKNKPDGTMRKLTDVSKLNALGWHHTIEIEEGIARLIDWYRSEE